jgi:hypothetical protein
LTKAPRACNRERMSSSINDDGKIGYENAEE